MIIGDAVTKTAFANMARSVATQLAVVIEDIKELQEAYVSRGYATGGADAIIDADIVDAKITASDLTSFLAPAWLGSRLIALMSEQVVSGTIAGNSIVDKIRTDM
jgi:hypothetical protein